MAPSDTKGHQSLYIGLFVLFVAALVASSTYSYLLFHTAAELFSIVIAAAIFIVAWNSRQYLDNRYFLIIGVAYLFIAGIDLVHTLAYSGMNIFPGYDANLPTQLWIAARYLESVTLLIAPLAIAYTFSAHRLFGGYAAVFVLLMLSIFVWGIFPDCFIEGEGLTLFKVWSEYMISAILVVSALLLYRRRSTFEPHVLQLVIASIAVTIAAELAFTFYIGVYDFSNLVGHVLKIASFALIYVAVVETGIRRPVSLFNKTLTDSEQRYRTFVQSLQGIAFQRNFDFSLVFIHGTVEAITGHAEAEFGPGGLRWDQIVHPDDLQRLKEAVDLFRSIPGYQTEAEYRVLHRDGTVRWVREHAQSIGDGTGTPVLVQGTVYDITEQKRAESAIISANEKLNLLNRITRHDISNQLNVLIGYLEVEKDLVHDAAVSTYISKQESAAWSIQHYLDFTRDYQQMGVNGPVWHPVAETFSLAASQIDTGKIRFEITVDGLEVYADPLLEKVFANLVDNTLRHGGEVSCIRLSFRKVPDRSVILVYEDNGSGISVDEKERIFTAGYGKNHGYGLFLVSEILGITGMTIGETGLPGSGARFEMRIPNGAYRFPSSAGSKNR
jgi:PAS domain S-box-containing protein